MGAFAIYNDRASETTAISNLFIDDYMKDANDAQLKVYLYLVRMMSAGQVTSISDMADLFNHTEKEIIRSLRYWERKGLLTLQTDAAGNLSGIYLREPRAAMQADHQVISIAPMLASAAPAAEAKTSPMSSATAAAPVPAKGSDISASQMEEFQKSDANRQLMLIVEQYIGKPLSVREAKTICFIAEQLHFSDDLIDYLVEYCVGLGKKDFRYIEKVALNWAEAGISTTAQAQKSVQNAQSGAAGSRSPRNTRNAARSYQTFEKTSYDMDELERRLLSN